MTSEASTLSDLIGDIYDAALDPTLWLRALERSCNFIGGSSAVLYWHDVASESSAALHLFNDDPHYTRLYFEKYMPMNPVFPAATFIESGLIYTPTDIVPEAELFDTRFHREWVQPQGITDVVCVNLEKGTTSSSVLNIRRDETHGIVDDAVRQQAALLVPHFQRAVAIGRLFDQRKTAQAVLTETLDNVEAAIFLLGLNGRIVFVNELARTMLDEGALLHERRGALAAVAPDAQRLLRELVVAAESGDLAAGSRGAAIPLSDSPSRRWFAHVLPLTAGDRQRAGALHSAVAAVFVRKTSPASPPPLEALGKLYSLTASEIRVLDGIMKVSGVQALADLLGLSQATVKTHLHNVFRKTGTARQSELVKLIAGFERPATD
ncbi:helix-turn-helix transcriptional regulator [Bradyrhizobium sp. CB2312]|uniref:helix-turn-helix transcriptional regulator n=1 Tax=Bradyrhizobium sp. CB2312 TaxID=3039155 RepID=UPI0024B1EEA9|nr:helix-turn-helix transcriptional regulator [Bradyrhizobium sp. CB2312]WFU71806.1 helix-turn-helix transcriptional regulator [Bradyrhizobium sp. CB2312]